MSFTPSKFQQDIFDFVEFGSGSAIIEAVAGSGKTTTIVKALHLIPRGDTKVIFLAFNKSIATELQEKVPRHVWVKTLNALGYGAWRRHMGNVKIEVDGDKTRKIIKELEGYDERMLKRFTPSVRRLVGIAKSLGIVPNDIQEASGLIPDTDETWNRLIDHYDITFKDEYGLDSNTAADRLFAIRLTRHVLGISIDQQNWIDFDDMLYLPVIFKIRCYKYDFIMVDEAQDVSDIQRALLGMVKKRSGRLIAVGDPHQAIYGFRGADSESLPNIAKIFNCTRLPLSISYRCPKAIIREAKKFVRHIESHESAPEGKVSELGEYDCDMFKPEDLVVCRNSAPLIRMAYYLIGSRVAVTVLGRDMGKGLVTLINKFKASSIHDLRVRLYDWYEKTKAAALEKDVEADLSGLEDKYEVIQTFISYSGAATVEQLIAAIQNLFSEKKNGGVILSTIHKAKGLEADRVFILDRWMMPSKYAKKIWQRKQENNLQYVAVTRAKSELAYIDSPKKD